MTIQKLVDNVTYPQNLYYNVDTLEPKGLLVNRCNVFKKYCPQLFEKQKSFLDIGCATGYFLFHHAKNNTRVVGIEPDKKLFNICSLIDIYKDENTNLELLNIRFKNYVLKEKFDLIFLGNCFHYLYEDEGWNILKKLSKIRNGQIIIEAPLEGSHLVEIHGWNENEKSKDYTRDRFIEEASKFFKIQGIYDSGTIGMRNVVVLK